MVKHLKNYRFKCLFLTCAGSFSVKTALNLIFLIYDAIEINGINLIAIIPEVLMVIYDLVIISKSIKEVKI